MSILSEVKDKYGTSTRLNLGIIISVVEVAIKDLSWPVPQQFIF
jgi:hypothetical protein